MDYDKLPLQVYLREVATIQPLAKDEEHDLLRHVQAQDEMAESATKRLIEGNLYLVVSVVEKYSSAGLSMLDLIEKGNESLLAALRTFSGDTSESFSAHAAACIEHAVAKAVAESRS